MAFDVTTDLGVVPGGRTSLRWSLDGRSLAVSGNSRAIVVSGEGMTNVWTSVGVISGWPNW